MAFKGSGEMAIITFIINGHEYFENYIPSIENWFGDNKVSFQDNNAFFLHKAKCIKAILQVRNINSKIKPMNKSDLIPIENLWRYFFKWSV